MEHKTKSLSRYWLLVGVIALAIAGLYSLVLVVARNPSTDIPVFNTHFHRSLVAHVDLSELVWFLAIACLLWSLLSAHRKQVFPMLEEGALAAFALGIACITVAPLDFKADALMSNYVPVIISPVFFMGLGLVFAGVLLMLVRFFTAAPWRADAPVATRYAVLGGGVIAAMAMVSFVWSHVQMPGGLSGREYYEILFWGGGHMLQFMHAQMLLVCWLMLLWALVPQKQFNRWVLKGITSVGLAVTLLTPLAYLLYNVESYEQRNFFTQGMILAGGIAPGLLGVLLLPTVWKNRAMRKGQNRALWASLATSVVLFLYGGFLGELIRNQNTVIPAHYHGAIGGITLAFTGIAYLLLPQFGYRNVAGWRLAYWQPYVYFCGMMMHVSGLAWSGGYGVLRKTPGVIANISPDVYAALGCMVTGGMVAIIGGLMFVIVMVKGLRTA